MFDSSCDKERFRVRSGDTPKRDYTSVGDGPQAGGDDGRCVHESRDRRAGGGGPKVRRLREAVRKRTRKRAYNADVKDLKRTTPVAVVVAGHLLSVAGCAPRTDGMTTRARAIASAAEPILNADPEAIWTECYNRLVELSPESLVWLAEHPRMRRACAPDDLRLMMHVSLLRLVADPRGAPALSVNCLETTLDLVHFDLKIGGERPGPVYWPGEGMPARWHDLYPAEFDHTLAASVDAEADRRALCAWWDGLRREGQTAAARGMMRPRVGDLWRIVGRRHADLWVMENEPNGVIPCAWGERVRGGREQTGGWDEPTSAALHFGRTRDYNLVRAACLWLGTRPESEVRDRLIGLVGHESGIVSYNAVFALRRSTDARIRKLLEEFERRPNRDEERPERQL